MRRIAMICLLAAAGTGPGCTGNGSVGSMNSDGGDMDGQIGMNSSQNETKVAERAVSIAGEHLGVAEAELTVVSVEVLDWPDSSAGCPQPGQSYLQVITPGHKALVRHGDRVVPVHFAGGRGFVCESSKAGVKEIQPRIHRLPPGQLAELARADLAQRLGVARDEVRVLSTDPVQWRDTSLGCPLPGQAYEDSTIHGFVINLAHNGDRYRYHSDQLRVFPCPPVARE